MITHIARHYNSTAGMPAKPVKTAAPAVMTSARTASDATATSADTTSPAATTYHTPFGDVLATQITNPEMAKLSSSNPTTATTRGTTPVTPPTTSTGGSTTTSGTPAPTGPSQAALDFISLFTAPPVTGTPPPATPPASPAPTPQSVFGDQVWVQHPTGVGPGGSSFNYNPIYFATQSTAQKVAALVGGTVIQTNTLASGGGFQQSTPNEMVQLPNGKLINPGLVADFFNHGYPDSYIQRMIQQEVQGAVSA